MKIRNNGVLYGLSSGPGDPKLLTVKAVEVLEHVSVIAAPRTGKGHTMALDIVSQIIDIKEKEIVYLDMAMKKDLSVIEEIYDRHARLVEDYLASGRDVAMLSIGDVSLYSTFSYVAGRVKGDGFEVEVIPGVTSFNAVAATLGKSLTVMGKPLTIIPGSFENNLELLDRPGTKVIMKSASALGAVRDILIDKGLKDKAAAVADCGLPTQRVYRDITELPDAGEYFVTLMIDD